MKQIFFLSALCMFILVACEKSQPYENESSIFVFRGMMEEEAKTWDWIAELDYTFPEVSNPMIFNSKNIQWFNPRTREIKFHQIEPFEILTTYQRIIFEMNGEELFRAKTVVSNIESFVCLDLVLFYDVGNGKYYLRDCYPDWGINYDQTKINIQKRKKGWNKFIDQMRRERKLRQ